MSSAPTTGASASTDAIPGPAAEDGRIAVSPASEETLRLDAAKLEQRTIAIGRELFDRIGRGPKPWQRAWWEEKFIAGTLDDPLVRVQLLDRKSTRLNSSHQHRSRMPSSA